MNKGVHLSYFIQWTNLTINAGGDKKNQLKIRSHPHQETIFRPAVEKFDHSRLR